jgi:hypothetical protein
MTIRLRHVTPILATALAGLAMAADGPGPDKAPSRARPATLSCAPTPCTLPPTQASEGGATDSPIAANPAKSQQLLVGSVDVNCTGGSNVGEHLSTDGGSSWTRVDCMPTIKVDGRNYPAVGLPSVGYDVRGNAYAAGQCVDFSGRGANYGLVAVQKSTDGTTWNAPVAALVPSGHSDVDFTHMSVDASPASPHVGAVYVSGVTLPTTTRTRKS